MTLNELLRHHVSGAIERGEAEAIKEQPTPQALQLRTKRLEKRLKKLARELKYSDSIYDKNGRIFAFEQTFKVKDSQLFHGKRLIDIATLQNGHGQTISY